MDAAEGIVPSRACGGCTLCCKLMRVASIDKPWGQWCPDCAIGVGCKIYPGRPHDCQVWLCAYLKNADVPDTWYPQACHMVIDDREGWVVAHVYVDPDYAEAWRTEPFYSDLKNDARDAFRERRWIAVHVGTRQFVILPDKDLDMGEIGDDEEVAFAWVTPRPGGDSRPVPFKRPKGSQSPPDPSLWR